MPNADADNLIDAFLSGGAGDLDDAARLRLANLLDTESDVQRALDEAIHTESLLIAAHADPAAEQRSIKLLKSRLKAQPLATAEHPTPAMPRRPSLNRRFTDAQNVTRLPAPTPISAWTALAASIVVLFGFAFYFIYDPSASSDIEILKKDEHKNSLYAVTSGTVSVDGKNVHDVAENEWLSVPNSGPVTLHAKDGSNITFESGTRALLRKRGATLVNGAGRFGVTTGAENFVVQTPLGKVNASSGEFEARLEAGNASTAPEASKTLVLAVTVASGSAEVECAGKKTLLNEAGVTRRFAEETERRSEAPEPDDAKPHLRPPELRATLAILEQEKKLALTPDQIKQLRELEDKFASASAKVEKDAKVQELHIKARAAREAHDQEAGRDIQEQIRARADEILGPDGRLGDPMEFLSDSQRRIIGPTVHEIMREKHGPMGEGEQPPHRPNSERPPPPPPRRGDAGDDRPPPR